MHEADRKILRGSSLLFLTSANANGFAHGGVLSYLTDNALTIAGAMGLGRAVLTSEFKINYLRPDIGTTLVARVPSPSVHPCSQPGPRCQMLDHTQRCRLQSFLILEAHGKAPGC